MESKLAEISSLPQKDKAAAFVSLLTEVLSVPDQSSLQQNIHVIIENSLQDNVGIVGGRQVLTELVKLLEKGAVKDTELTKQIVEDTLSLIQPRIINYEEQVCPRILA